MLSKDAHCALCHEGYDLRMPAGCEVAHALDGEVKEMQLLPKEGEEEGR